MGEMPLYVLCAVAGCLLVLFLSLESWLTPFLFMLGLLFPLVYNFGTNIFWGRSASSPRRWRQSCSWA